MVDGGKVMKIFAQYNLSLALEIAIISTYRWRNAPRRFADNEVFVEILENMRGEDAFLIQSTSYPANDHLMELLIMIDAQARVGTTHHRCHPYFGYARQTVNRATHTHFS